MTKCERCGSENIRSVADESGTYSVCGDCGGDVEEYERCSVCGEELPTYSLYGFGPGYLCRDCHREIKKSIEHGCIKALAGVAAEFCTDADTIWEVYACEAEFDITDLRDYLKACE